MNFSMTFFRLVCALAAGGFCSLALVPQDGVSRGFFRFCGFLYAGLIAVGLAVRPPAGDLDTLVGGALLGAVALGAAGAAFASRLGRAGGRVVLTLAAAAALAGVAASGWAGGGRLPGLGGIAAVLSAALLGSVFTAMILGHWYLVMPLLPPDPLLVVTRFFAASVLLRIAAVAGTLVLLDAAGGRALGRFLDAAGLMVAVRVLFGLLGPAALALMTLPTVKVRDTQPATGMLYVACVLVLVGEGIAHYLGVRTGVPI